MKTVNDNLNLNFDDPVWNCLIEYPLTNLIADSDIQDDPTTRSLIQTLIDLGVRPELLNNIVRKLIKVAQGVTSEYNHHSSDAPLYLRLYCPRMTRRDVNTMKPTSAVVAESVKQTTQVFRSADHEINRGWEYLMVERGGRARRDSAVGCSSWIDMYLYRQGE